MPACAWIASDPATPMGGEADTDTDTDSQQPVIHIDDTFDGDSLSPDWTVTFDNTEQPSLELTGSELAVTSLGVGAEPSTWATLYLDHELPDLEGDFTMTATLGWRSDITDMQRVELQALSEGTLVYRAGFSDDWVAHLGTLVAMTPSMQLDAGPDEQPMAAQATVEFRRRLGSTTATAGPAA